MTSLEKALERNEWTQLHRHRPSSATSSDDTTLEPSSSPLFVSASTLDDHQDQQRRSFLQQHLAMNSNTCSNNSNSNSNNNNNNNNGSSSCSRRVLDVDVTQSLPALMTSRSDDAWRMPSRSNVLASNAAASNYQQPHTDEASHDNRQVQSRQEEGESHSVGSIPVPGMTKQRFASSARSRFLHSSSSSSSSGSNSNSEEDDESAAPGLSKSYFKPSTLDGYSKYFEPLYMEGYLEKKSQKQQAHQPPKWKKRWFVMNDSQLFYYKDAKDVKENKPSDPRCCGVIELDSVDSVTTAKDFGVGAFQISLESRRYFLRAESKDRMHDWLFNFQRSIANIVSMLLRSKQSEHRNRLSHNITRRGSSTRMNRSISFDFQDYTDQLGAMYMEEFYRRETFGGGEGSSIDAFSGNDSDTGSGRSSSPRRASSPMAYSGYGPRSPLGMMTMFPIDPLEGDSDDEDDDDIRTRQSPYSYTQTQQQFRIRGRSRHQSIDTPPFELYPMTPPVADLLPKREIATQRQQEQEQEQEQDEEDEEEGQQDQQIQAQPGGEEEEEKDEAEDEVAPTLLQSKSPPFVSTGKYIPPFLRNRQANATLSPSNSSSNSASPRRSLRSFPEPSPKNALGSGAGSPRPAPERWVPPHQREGFRKSTEPSAVPPASVLGKEDFYFDDDVSYCIGDETHGVTSLLGVRKSMEDVCCCIPDLNAHLALTDDSECSQRQSMYALFDGHCGIRAALFSKDRLVKYLCGHQAFFTDTRVAFSDCFRRIDREFLLKASEENLSDGTTAAVVLIRGNRLLTANVGDCRAVVSISGLALDVIQEQTPGREDERLRIEKQGGWVKEERELQMSKLHSMDLSDPAIKRKAERVVRWVNVYRVNGELAVSRAIGDYEYKGDALVNYEFWAFPEGHDRQFHGDLIIPDPEFQEIEITPEVEFLVLACDGLWDTITSQEAVDHVSEKLREGYSIKEVSHSLASLAIRSGSSDNVSVVVVLLHPDMETVTA